MQTESLPAWSATYILIGTEVREAIHCVPQITEMYVSGHMYDAYGPFETKAEAYRALETEDPSGAGLTRNAIDWRGFSAFVDFRK